MATKLYLFDGTCKWAKLDVPDEKYQKYQIDVYLDSENRQIFDNSGLQLKVKEDEGGEFVTFRRPVKSLMKGELKEWGAPKVTLLGKPYSGKIGNGSYVKVEVSVYDTVKGPGHRLESVDVEELIEYPSKSTDGGLDVDL